MFCCENVTGFLGNHSMKKKMIRHFCKLEATFSCRVSAAAADKDLKIILLDASMSVAIIIASLCKPK